MRPKDQKEALIRMPDISLAPYVGPLDFFAQEVAGGKEQFIEGCRFSDNPRVQSIVRLWNSSSPDTSLEDLCTQADIKPDELVGEATKALFKWKRMWAKWKNAQKLPDVMEASANAALCPNGVEDRKMQLQIGGILPMPGGNSINILNNPQVGGLPTFEEDMSGGIVDVTPEPSAAENTEDV